MGAFLTDYHHIVSLINGLAFFVLGLSAALQSGGVSARKLTPSLRMLSGYGFMAALANWLRMFMLTQMSSASPRDTLWLQTARLLCMVLASACLLRFATQLVAHRSPRYRWLLWGLPVLCGLYILIVLLLFTIPHTSRGDWVSTADVWARYLLLLPSLALTALGMWGEHRDAAHKGLSRIAGDSLGVALAFGFKAIASGLIAVPVFGTLPSLPMAAIFAVSTSRILATTISALFLARFLYALDVERDRQLDIAHEQRFEAQQQARSEVERWARQMESVVDSIASITSRASTLEDILSVSLNQVLELTPFEAGNFLLAQAEEGALQLVMQSGLSADAHKCSMCLQSGPIALEEARTSGETVVVWNLFEDPDRTCDPCKEAGFRCLVSVPVTCRGELLGVMNLLSKDDIVSQSQGPGMLSVIGRQIGMAIENTRLREQAQNTATLEERERLGRELHDGLAQVLGYLHLKNHRAAGLLSSGEIAAVEAELGEMHEATQEALKEVRRSIFGLRTTLTPDIGILSALTRYIQRFSQQSGINTQLVVGSDVTMELGPAAEIQLLRIVQEALTNTEKHAQANRAWVRLEIDDEAAVISIEDDGRGFDLEGIDRDGHYGVHTMRERAECVEGHFEILTGMGQGTRVVVRLPFARQRG